MALAAFPSSAAPASQLIADLSASADLDREELSSLTHACVDFVLSRDASEFAIRLESFPAAKAAARGLLSYLSAAYQHRLSAIQLSGDLSTLGLDGARVAAVVEVWEGLVVSRAPEELRDGSAARRLVDLDWKFGVTASTDMLRGRGMPFLQLKLSVEEGSGVREVLVEMTLEQFFAFLADMEKAKALLDIMAES